MINTYFKNKYLKYKTKYLNKMKGGVILLNIIFYLKIQMMDKHIK